MSPRQCIALTLEYLACCQRIAEYVSQMEGGNNIQQRFQKYLLQGDSFALDSMLHLLSEIVQPVLSHGRHQIFLQFAIEIENRNMMLQGLSDSRLTNGDSDKTEKVNQSATPYGEIMQAIDSLKRAFQSSIGLFGVAELAR